MSDLTPQDINNFDNLCEDATTKGFDLQAGQSWIYPTNCPVREYQYNIIHEALHKNTLVSLPTGLGKTFIAAVVMYNFYRWYPHGKIIFMAPTRPLVKQQMDACYNIMAIPQETTAELTGSKGQASRKEIWTSKRVFFITPQVLQNDLSPILKLAGRIKCLVFDEAHRAKGNHAYCEVIKKLLPENKLFRVLALSATPGNSAKDVLEVMGNLLIAHLEFRSEESPDVKPYVFERALETVVVPLGEKLEQIRDQYLQVLEKYTRTLVKYKVINGNYGNLTKGKIFMTMKEFQSKHAGNRLPNYGEIMKCLNICITLYHAYETLVRCGLRAFLNFYEAHINDPLMNGNFQILQIMDDLKQYLGPAPEVQALPDGSLAPLLRTTKFGHPKFYQLENILLNHFRNSNNTTRVIAFFEYRESVQEAYALLSKNWPVIKARIFVGQGSGVTQKDQISTVKAFREGTCNTLLSTCIGEEGLDVGEVDLIVCFDIANKSPIRMIQRMGRTGRKKEGRIVVLVTEGKEQQTLKDCLIYKSNLGTFVLNSSLLEQGKYKDNPAMIPTYITPKCQKMFITVTKPVMRKSGNLKALFGNMPSKSCSFDEDLEIVDVKERITNKSDFYWTKSHPLMHNFDDSNINFLKHLEKQRVFQRGGLVKNSTQTEIFVGLLQFADSKRYNIPLSQTFNKFTSMSEQNKQLKQGDIRSMFARPIYEGEQTTVSLSQIENVEKDTTQLHAKELFVEIANFLSIQEANPDNCKICTHLFECPKIERCQPEPIDLKSCVLPDLEVLDGITAQDWNLFGDFLAPEMGTFHSSLDEDDLFDDVDFTKLEKDLSKHESLRNFDHILESFRVCDDAVTQPEEKSFAYEIPKGFDNVLKRLRDSVCPKYEKTEIINLGDYNDILTFFKVSSIEEMFEDLDETLIYTPEEAANAIPLNIIDQSPDIFAFNSDSKNSSIEIEESQSPILCSLDRTQQLKAKKRLFETSKILSIVDEVVSKPNLRNLKTPKGSFYVSNRKAETPKQCENAVPLDIGDICDLSQFGLSCKNIPDMKETVENSNLDLGDICDLSVFGISGDTSKKKPEKEINKKKPSVGDSRQVSNLNRHEDQAKVINKIKKLGIGEFCDMSEFVGASTSKTSEPIEQFSNLGDFCDLSFFENEVNTGLGQVLRRNPAVNLTNSPSKIQKHNSQMGITQMLSLIGKTENVHSQKENELSVTTPPTKKLAKTRKFVHSASKKCVNSLKTNLLVVSAGENSDDEFEEMCKSQNFPRPKYSPVFRPTAKLHANKTPRKLFGHDEGVFAKPTFLTPKKRDNRRSNKTSKRFCEFLDEEAEVSEDEPVSADEENADEDNYEASFVADETQDLNTTDVHAKYLESVKSPVVGGKFKIPLKPRHDVSYIFSQEVNNEDNTYVNDSFCVDTQDVDNVHNLSELEILEMKLKDMKKSKKRKKNEDKPEGKRRRIITFDDSD